MNSRSLWALTLLLGLCSAHPGDSVCLQSNAASCDECIRVSGQCGWCSDESFLDPNDPVSLRCLDLPSRAAENCRTIESPRGGVTVTTNMSFTGATRRRAAGERVVQIQPQKISLALRVGEPQTFSLRFRPASDLPVDLYFLTDLSTSMKDDLENIRSLGSELMKEMQQLTSDFRIGLGVISKTNAAVSPRPPCTQTQDCPSPFEFRNLLSLTDRAEQFDTVVQQQEVSENMDSPEGGFNSMMQVALCEEQIGWREDAVRLLVVATDGAFHPHGDGKPLSQGGRCEMENGVYVNTGPGGAQSTVSNDDSAQNTEPTVRDLAMKLYQKKIQTILTVTENRRPRYQELKDNLPKATVGTLTSNSSNVLELILEAYRSLSSEVILDNSRLPDGLYLSFKSMCPSGEEGLGEVGGRKCNNVSTNDEVVFEVSVTVQKCPLSPRDPVLLKMGVLGFTAEVEVELNFLCECPCSAQRQPHSDRCSQKGALECGSCRCDPGWLGGRCQCSADDFWSLDGTASCRSHPQADICSNNGDCVCGACECRKRENPKEKYSGQYCECDNFNCDRSNNKLCGGHGRCECRTCICDLGYTGSACDCSLDQTSCLAKNGQICNGRGTCDCGVCKCTDPKFQGPTCEICPTCPGVCTEHKDCVQCRAWGSGAKAQSCQTDCSYFSLTMVQTVDALPQPNMDTQPISHCKERDQNDCWFYYTYSVRNGNKEVHAVQNMACPSVG